MADADPHLLIVDDDERIRGLLQKFLSRQGFWVSAARDASHARRLLSGLEFDLIVLDVMMPGEDGVTFCRDLRETVATPILLLTAKGETRDRIVGLEAGADDYLPKPFEPRELLPPHQCHPAQGPPGGTDRYGAKGAEPRPAALRCGKGKALGGRNTCPAHRHRKPAHADLRGNTRRTRGTRETCRGSGPWRRKWRWCPRTRHRRADYPPETQDRGKSKAAPLPSDRKGRGGTCWRRIDPHRLIQLKLSAASPDKQPKHAGPIFPANDRSHPQDGTPRAACGRFYDGDY